MGNIFPCVQAPHRATFLSSASDRDVELRDRVVGTLVHIREAPFSKYFPISIIFGAVIVVSSGTQNKFRKYTCLKTGYVYCNSFASLRRYETYAVEGMSLNKPRLNLRLEVNVCFTLVTLYPVRIR